MVVSILIGGAVFILELIGYPRLIKYLNSIKFSQVERELGPESHLKKQGTPTMGGVLFGPLSILSIIILAIIYNYLFFSIALLMVFFMALGLYDDYNKVIKKNPNALKAKMKLFIQFVIVIIYLIVLFYIMKFDRAMYWPFKKNTDINFTFLTFPILAFIILGTDTAANFTDGIDGLLTSMTIVLSIFFTAVSIKQNSNIYLIGIVAVFFLCGFLIFNHYKAKIFMGDTGALCLGGYIAGMSILLKIELYLPLFAFVYLMEVVSVIMQVSYFKMTNGKRIFKMTPIHHHFEKCGLSEVQVVLLFTGVTAVLCTICFILI